MELTNWSEEQIDQSPDPNLPVAEQLEYSVRKIKELMTSLNEMKKEVSVAKKEALAHEAKLQEKETAIMSRDKIINELRLRMPASSNRDDILRDVLNSDPHLQHSAKVAQQLNDNLKVSFIYFAQLANSLALKLISYNSNFTSYTKRLNSLFYPVF